MEHVLQTSSSEKDRPKIKPKTDRIEILDVYRGFAILGIFVVNIVIMNSTFLNQDIYLEQFTSGIDAFAQQLLQLFFYTKFFPIFSLLFGVGIAMQARKLQEKKIALRPFFMRRMLFLFLFGVLHILLLWSGDVVHLYAILGLLMIVLFRIPAKWLLILSVIVLIFPFYDPILGEIMQFLNYNPVHFLKGLTGSSVNTIIRQGSYLDGMHLRMREYFANLPMLLAFLAPVALSMIMLGMYLSKKLIFNDLRAFLNRIKIPMLIVAVVTNVYRIIFLFYLPETPIYKEFRPIFIKSMVISDVFMGIFYLWLLGFLWYFTPFQNFLKPLKYVGKMALSNYILQSIIGLFLFSSVGFGRYEHFSPSGTLAIAVLVFLFQIVFSKIWLHYFRFGPLEWLWRCLTYQEYIPLKINK